MSVRKEEKEKIHQIQDLELLIKFGKSQRFSHSSLMSEVEGQCWFELTGRLQEVRYLLCATVRWRGDRNVWITRLVMENFFFYFVYYEWAHEHTPELDRWLKHITWSCPNLNYFSSWTSPCVLVLFLDIRHYFPLYTSHLPVWGSVAGVVHGMS